MLAAAYDEVVIGAGGKDLTAGLVGTLDSDSAPHSLAGIGSSPPGCFLMHPSPFQLDDFDRVWQEASVEQQRDSELDPFPISPTGSSLPTMFVNGDHDYAAGAGSPLFPVNEEEAPVGLYDPMLTTAAGDLNLGLFDGGLDDLDLENVVDHCRGIDGADDDTVVIYDEDDSDTCDEEVVAVDEPDGSESGWTFTKLVGSKASTLTTTTENGQGLGMLPDGLMDGNEQNTLEEKSRIMEAIKSSAIPSSSLYLRTQPENSKSSPLADDADDELASELLQVQNQSRPIRTRGFRSGPAATVKRLGGVGKRGSKDNLRHGGNQFSDGRVKLYNAGPFEDPSKERARLNAVNARRNRERQRLERKALAEETQRLRFNNQQLVRLAAALRERATEAEARLRRLEALLGVDSSDILKSSGKNCR